MRVYKIQEESLRGLLLRLKEFETSGMGKIENVGIMTNNSFPTSIFVQYLKSSANALAPVSDYELVQIDADGNIVDFNKMFDGPFQRYAFLGECLTQNMESIEIID